MCQNVTIIHCHVPYSIMIVNIPLEDQGGQNDPSPAVFPKYLRDKWIFFNEILANPKLRIDTLTNILKFLKVVRFLVGKALKLR